MTNIKKENLETSIKEIRRSQNLWLFQVNQKRYNINAVMANKNKGDNFRWLVPRYRDRINSGDIVIIWGSGGLGILAVGKIYCNPIIMKDVSKDLKYWLNPNDRNIKDYRVEIELLLNLSSSPISKQSIISQSYDLNIFRNFRGTNFPIDENDKKIYITLLSNFQKLELKSN